MDIADLDSLAGKWSLNTVMAVDDWIEGYQNPKKEWETEMAKAEDRWAEAATREESVEMWRRGVQACGVEGFIAAMEQYGFDHYQEWYSPPMIELYIDHWLAGFWDNYAPVLRELDLPAKTKVNEENWRDAVYDNVVLRVAPVCVAMAQRKRELEGKET